LIDFLVQYDAFYDRGELVNVKPFHVEEYILFIT